MYVYRYQNRTQSFFGGGINRGLAGMGEDTWANVPGGNPSDPSSDNYKLLHANDPSPASGSGGSFADQVSSIGKALSPIATAYLASRTPAASPAQRTTFVTTAAGPQTASGMSTTTKLVLAGVGVLLVGLLVLKRRR